MYQMKQEGRQPHLVMGQTGVEVKIEPSSPEFSSVKPDQVDFVFAALDKQIQRALSRGQGDGTTPEHMKAAIIRGDMYMWAVVADQEIVACIVLSVRQTDTIKKLIIQLLAGRDSDWWGDELETLLQDFKDLVGATCIEACCRPGVVKKLHNRGWRKKSVVMELR
jgi:hypothetical protein